MARDSTDEETPEEKKKRELDEELHEGKQKKRPEDRFRINPHQSSGLHDVELDGYDLEKAKQQGRRIHNLGKKGGVLHYGAEDAGHMDPVKTEADKAREDKQQAAEAEAQAKIDARRHDEREARLKQALEKLKRKKRVMNRAKIRQARAHMMNKAWEEEAKKKGVDVNDRKAREEFKQKYLREHKHDRRMNNARDLINYADKNHLDGQKKCRNEEWFSDVQDKFHQFSDKELDQADPTTEKEAQQEMDGAPSRYDKRAFMAWQAEKANPQALSGNPAPLMQSETLDQAQTGLQPAAPDTAPKTPAPALKNQNTLTAP